MPRPARSFVLAATLAAATLAAPAAHSQASAWTDVDFALELFEGRGGVYAVMTVESPYGLRVHGSIDLWVNGNVFKVEPVETSSVQYVVTVVGTGADELDTCAFFDGVSVVYGDNVHRVFDEACGSFVPKPKHAPIRLLRSPDLALEAGTAAERPRPAQLDAARETDVARR